MMKKCVSPYEEIFKHRKYNISIATRGKMAFRICNNFRRSALWNLEKENNMIYYSELYN